MQIPATGTYRIIKFESSQLVPVGDGWVLRGQLTARGQAAPVELAVTESRGSGDGLTLRATTGSTGTHSASPRRRAWPPGTSSWRSLPKPPAADPGGTDYEIDLSGK